MGRQKITASIYYGNRAVDGWKNLAFGRNIHKLFNTKPVRWGILIKKKSFG